MSNPKNNSFSRIDQFSRCERYSFFNATQPVEPTKVRKEAMEFGSAVHECLEAVGAARIDKLDERDALQAGKIQRRLKAYPEGMDDYLEAARPVLDVLQFQSVESWFRDVDGLPIIGKIDVVSKTTPIFKANVFDGNAHVNPCVLDWKCTKKPYNAFRALSDIGKSLQLQIYCIAAGIKTACYVYLLPGGRIMGATAVYNDAQLKLTKRWLETKIGVINNRWQQASNDDGTFDMEMFDIARVDDYLCSSRFCEFWDKCLGRKENDNGKCS